MVVAQLGQKSQNMIAIVLKLKFLMIQTLATSVQTLVPKENIVTNQEIQTITKLKKVEKSWNQFIRIKLAYAFPFILGINKYFKNKES